VHTESNLISLIFLFLSFSISSANQEKQNCKISIILAVTWYLL